ncbi:MAG: lamin tail domain-containing protein [Chloroflexi bacterium]|nr:lamin tail domain-containing protein [Chloroflexota bacterium]
MVAPENSEPVEDGPITHIVQSGETLRQYQPALQRHRRGHHGRQRAGQRQLHQRRPEFIIPIGGLPTPTIAPSQTPLPHTPPTPIATEAPPTQGEAIVKISGVSGVGSLTAETIQIINSGNRQIGLLNWTLSDESGYTYKFRASHIIWRRRRHPHPHRSGRQRRHRPVLEPGKPHSGIRGNPSPSLTQTAISSQPLPFRKNCDKRRMADAPRTSAVRQRSNLMRGIIDRKGEQFAYLQGNVLYDLEDRATRPFARRLHRRYSRQPPSGASSATASALWTVLGPSATSAATIPRITSIRNSFDRRNKGRRNKEKFLASLFLCPLYIKNFRRRA